LFLSRAKLRAGDVDAWKRSGVKREMPRRVSTSNNLNF
jgi:hypothetical protein